MKTNYRAIRMYQSTRTRTELTEYLNKWAFEIESESCPRHLENVSKACHLLLENLVRLTGVTTETTRYTAQVHELAAASVEMWLPEEKPGLAKAKPRLSVVPGGAV